jgi:hypothetical protein
MNKGLGDTVSSMINNISGGRIKECGGCRKRKAWLNRNIPYSVEGLIDTILANKNTRTKNK